MNLKYIILVGSTPLGIELLTMLIANKNDMPVLGYLDDQGPSDRYEKLNVGYLGTLKDWKVTAAQNFLVVIEDVRIRIKYVEYISGEGGNFLSYIHPTVVLGKRVTFGEGVILGPYCVVGDYCHLGSFSIFSSKNIIQKSASIGLFCLLKNQVFVGEGISLGDGNFLSEGTVLKSCTGNFFADRRNLDIKEDINEKLGNIPWYGLN